VDSLLPVLVELALAGLTQAEIAALPVAAVDGEAGIVLIDGGPDAGGRNAVLLPTARVKVVRQVAALERLYGSTGDVFDPASVPLGLHPVPRSVRDRVRPTVVGQHLYRALKLAGITRNGVTPGSMRVYAANAVYACTNRVEDVAAALDIASLDVAFRLIEPTWQTSWAQHVREQEA
jgi:hypothetical protein